MHHTPCSLLQCIKSCCKTAVIIKSSNSFLHQLLLRSGRSPAEAMMILVPEAYKNHPTLSIKYPEVWNALVDIEAMGMHQSPHILTSASSSVQVNVLFICALGNRLL